jgi:phosphoribosylformylglycinamidine synthase
MVMTDTVERPGGDAAIVRVHDSEKALAITTDCTPRYCFADPVEGGRQVVAEAWRNLTAVGARPLAVTDNLNFGNPERPEIMAQLAGCIEGMAEACRALDFPVVSGNVSLYNETNGKAILPTPVIGAVGVIDDLSNRVTQGFTAEGQTIVILGETAGHVGASLWLREIGGLEAGSPPPVDLAAERRNGDLVRSLILENLVDACHDISDGGLLIAIAEMALAGSMGAQIDLPDGLSSPARWLFGEDQARYIVTTGTPDAVLARANDAGVPALVLGRSGGTSLTVTGERPISLDKLRETHEGWLPRYMSGP